MIYCTQHSSLSYQFPIRFHISEDRSSFWLLLYFHFILNISFEWPTNDQHKTYKLDINNDQFLLFCSLHFKGLPLGSSQKRIAKIPVLYVIITSTKIDGKMTIFFIRNNWCILAAEPAHLKPFHPVILWYFLAFLGIRERHRHVHVAPNTVLGTLVEKKKIRHDYKMMRNVDKRKTG